MALELTWPSWLHVEITVLLLQGRRESGLSFNSIKKAENVLPFSCYGIEEDSDWFPGNQDVPLLLKAYTSTFPEHSLAP